MILLMNGGTNMDIQDIVLKQTCSAYPEQYDAIDETTGKRVGYLRLRYGHFTVEVPDVYGELVYESWPQGSGAFENDERVGELAEAVVAIYKWYLLH